MALPNTGDAALGASVKNTPLAIPFPIVTKAEILDKDDPVNDTAISGKGAGRMCIVEDETTQTSGALIVGAEYTITTFVASDDFANVGGTNVTGNIFVATGTTPTTYTNSSVLTRITYTTVQANRTPTTAPWFPISDNVRALVLYTPV